MPRTLRSLMNAAAARLGRPLAYHYTADVEALLAWRTETVYARATGHAALATEKNTSVLAVQPCVLGAHGRVLAEVLYLEGLLTGARNRGLAPELIARLEDVVDHGHVLAVLLADTTRATTAHTSSGT